MRVVLDLPHPGGRSQDKKMAYVRVTMVMYFALAVGFLFPVAMALKARCRCLPGDPCWDLVDWTALNNSVSGRLAKSVDAMQACVSDPASPACTVALNKSDDEFWLSAQPNGFMHTGD